MAAPAPEAGLVLDRRRLYMLPTRVGWMLAATLLAMLLAAVNYNNGLAFALTFLVGSTLVVSMLYTHRNLSGLRVTPGRCRPAFAGQAAGFGLWLHNEDRRRRYGVCVVCDGREAARIDLAPGERIEVVVPRPSRVRGRIVCPPVAVTSDFPLGALYTWSKPVIMPEPCTVWPRPGEARPLAPTPDRRRYQDLGPFPDGDDFAGLREYRRGDPPRHVHWRTVARGQGMFTKLFAGAGQDTVWLDWEALPGVERETRLAVLARWVVDAETEGRRYGLRVPGTVLPPDHGPAQRAACLDALALFPPLPAEPEPGRAGARRWRRLRRAPAVQGA
jgi:uncharacterized protein (DUF58 family)